MEKWSFDDHSVAEKYSQTLERLTDNYRPAIEDLTDMARYWGREGHGHVIVETIKIRLMNCRDQFKFPTLYLADSILKNYPDPYKTLFSKDRVISDMFVHLFSIEREEGREKLYKLRISWTPLLTNDLLLALDHAVKRIDKAWPITAKQSSRMINPYLIRPKRPELLLIAEAMKEASKFENDISPNSPRNSPADAFQYSPSSPPESEGPTIMTRKRPAPAPPFSFHQYLNSSKDTKHPKYSHSFATLQVSNLSTSVSQKDLSELFGDIDHLKCVRMPNPGQAEVVFCNMEDAERAVDIYHNRLLDGKPMKCCKILYSEEEDTRMKAENERLVLAYKNEVLTGQNNILTDLNKELEKERQVLADKNERLQIERKLLADKTEKLEKNLQMIKNCIQTDPFFLK